MNALPELIAQGLRADIVDEHCYANPHWFFSRTTRFDGYPRTGPKVFFSEFAAHGGRGVEVVTGSHAPGEYAKYADLAIEFGLFASRGSDFHSPQESRTDLGALPDLPGRLTPVWEALHDRIQRS